jgi:maleylacetate reductase
VTLPYGRTFLHHTRDLRVRFQDGAALLVGEELDRLGLDRVFLVATSRGADEAAPRLESLGDRWAGTCDGARVHVPREVVEDARRQVNGASVDALLAWGGGSAVGVAKALSLESGLPILAVPTTYAGSEMTAVWGITEQGRKTTGRDDRVAPRVVLYDPSLTVSLPERTSAASGMNAVAHAVEALYAHDASPLSSLLAVEGIRRMAAALPTVVDRPGDLPARSDALCGAHLCGWALDMCSMGLHHKLCHVVGGTFDLPHALVHAVLLPYVVAYNAPAAPAAMEAVAEALGTKSAPEGLLALNRRLGLPLALADLGVGRTDLEMMVELAMRQSYPNPRPLERDGIRALLQAARDGDLGGVG